MLNQLGWFPTRSTPRSVDAEGRVWCPTQGRDVDLERCLACVDLDKTANARDGSVTTVVCHPRLS